MGLLVQISMAKFGRWGGEVRSGGVAAPLALTRRGMVRLDLEED